MTGVSVVVPTLNEGERLGRFLGDMADVLCEVEAPGVELLVVDDGSRPAERDAGLSAVERAGRRLEDGSTPHAIRHHRLERNRGKGYAIRHGWRNAAPAAAWLGFVDGDGAIEAAEVARLVSLLDGADFDALLASRIRMLGHDVARSATRHYTGRIFATLADLTFGFGAYDTQCGCKFVRGSILRPLLDELCEDRWLLDIELLALLGRESARMVEEPIDWHDPGGSNVRPVTDALAMALGLQRIRRRVAGR